MNWGEIGKVKEEINWAPVWRWQSGGLNFSRALESGGSADGGETTGACGTMNSAGYGNEVNLAAG